MAETAARATKKASASGAGTQVDPLVIDPGTPVHVAWTNVMREVEGLGKHQRNSEGGNYNFRGIDDLLNLVGPVLRKHGVIVIPTVQSASYRDVRTSRDKPAREVTVQVQFTIIGPNGDSIVGSAPGESMDNGDKGTAKAMSVAYRVFLLQSLTLPTNEPDPDSQTYERAPGKTPEQMAQETADRVPAADNYTALEGGKRWAAGRGLLDINVRDSDGNSRPLIEVMDEKLEALRGAAPAAQAARQAQVDQALGQES